MLDMAELVRAFHHDLRSVVGNIHSHVEHLLSERVGPLTAGQREALETAAFSLRRLNLMTDNLAQCVREESPVLNRREPVDLEALGLSVVDTFRVHAARAGVELHFNRTGEDPWVLGSEILLGRLADNLVSNAVKYTPEGGKVSVAVRGESDEVILEVADTGIGIARPEIPRVFARGYRTEKGRENRPEGLGIGLAICQEIALAHGARIDVESEVGRGSCFRVVFPS